MTYVAAEESGYKETVNIGLGAGTVGGVKSGYIKSKGKCWSCGNAKHGDGSPDEKAKHCPASGKTCSKCGKKNHLPSVCRSKPKVATVTESTEDAVNASMNFFVIKATSAPVVTVPQLSTIVSQYSRNHGSAPASVILPHSIHSVAMGWLQTRPDNSPMHEVELTVDKPSYTSMGLSLPSHSIRNKPSPRVKVSAVFDTGAQLNMTSPAMVTRMGYKMSDLFKVSTNVNSASNMKIHIMGGILSESCQQRNWCEDQLQAIILCVRSSHRNLPVPGLL